MGAHRQERCPVSHHVKMRKENTSLNWQYSLWWLTRWANLSRPRFPLFDQAPVFNSRLQELRITIHNVGGLRATCWRKALKLSWESCLSCPNVSLPPWLPLGFRHDYPKSACVDCISWLLSEVFVFLASVSLCAHIYSVCILCNGNQNVLFLHITYTITDSVIKLVFLWRNLNDLNDRYILQGEKAGYNGKLLAKNMKT